MENKYKIGDIVFERIHPATKLVISNYINGLYYCKLQGNSVRKAFVYFERELRPATALAVKN
jgi:uncharacterized protein YodC (DUF2158 family)